ncbi:hypothetical protein LCGC14_3128350, partial [marine sediment metagenome]
MSDYGDQRKRQAIRRRFEAKQLLEQLKSGLCEDCGDKFKSCQMDLVRREGGGPPMASLLLKSKKRILEEAEKRDLICANCGRLRVWERNRAER